MQGLPRSVRWACWFNAWSRGLVPIDEARDRVLGADAAHDLVGWDGVEPVALLAAFGRCVRSGATAARVVLPMPGDLYALGGPPAFNETALEAGEAVLLEGTGRGLVPRVVGRGVFWQAVEASTARAAVSLPEAERELRQELVHAARVLAELDAARWNPDVRSALSQARSVTSSRLAPGYSPRAAQVAELAVRCLAICDLARAGEDGTVTAHESRRRTDQLRALERAARHGLVAACNDHTAV